MKQVFAICILLVMCSISFSQSVYPSITIKRKVNSTYNLVTGTIPVLAGQEKTFKIIIEEPDEFHQDYFKTTSDSGQLKLFVEPSLAFDTAGVTFNYYQNPDNSDIFGNSVIDSLNNNHATIYQKIHVSGTANTDAITITGLGIMFPASLSDGESFNLKATADFTGKADDTTFTVATFEYKRPVIDSVMPVDGGGCKEFKQISYMC
jgi:hypothetical protein